MCEDHKTDLSRRSFGALALAGAAASLVPARAFGRQDPEGCKVTKIDALALMCIDYRLVTKTVNFLDAAPGPGSGKFDIVALAGASLASVATRRFEPTTHGFWQQVKAAWDLHKIEKIYVVDHMGCGAYCAEYGGRRLTPAQERALHIEVMMKLKRELPDRARRAGITDPLGIEFRMYPDPDAGPVPNIPPLVPELHP